MAGDPRALLAKADKTLAGASSGFSFFGGREEKYMNAADLYLEAANAFRFQNMSKEAGETFEKAASIQTVQLKEPDDAANTMTDAFKAYRNEYPADAVRCLEVAVNQYCRKGNFRRAAQHKENIGGVLESQLQDTTRALEAYETAAGWYEGDNATALANKLWLKVADLAGISGEYLKAAGLYEKIAERAVDNIMRYSVKDYLLKAGMCYLALGDYVAVTKAITRYSQLDPTFEDSDECRLLNDLNNAIDAPDLDQFIDKLAEYDQKRKLDQWKTAILVKIRDNLELAVEPDFS
ncbi:TPR-like protein [Xylariomycetidae sp. FL2044]|nr:TPR-like protein [Xylariomycetidae sp. FL2044]